MLTDSKFPCKGPIWALIRVAGVLLCTVATQPVQGQLGGSRVADFKVFTPQGNGVIDLATASQRLLVSSVQHCSALCVRLLVCSAFSTKKVFNKPPNAGGFEHYQCTLSMGDYSWTADADATLYIVDMEPLDGYALSTDGRYYKLLQGPWSISQVYTACDAAGGRLAVPYPGFAHKAISSFARYLPFNTFFVDMYLTGTVAENRWITADGAVFYVSNRTLDTDQRWDTATKQPDGCGYGLRFTAAGTFDDIDTAVFNATTALCRRDPMYRKSPVNGKFYKLHLEKVKWTEAAAECAKEGATLANVYSDADQNATEPYRIMTKALASNAFPNGFWVGGTDSQKENTWVFPDGTEFVLNVSGDPLQKRLWQSGEPNGGTSANCITMSYQGICDHSCDSATVLRRFLCEIQLP